MMGKHATKCALFSLLLLSGCTKTEKLIITGSTQAPLVTAVKTQGGVMKQSVAPDQSYTRSITARITLKKTALFGQDFFYGADLQYSSIYDKSSDLYSQSSAMGHVPVFFRANGKELQLIADDRRLYPSDVDHPERIVSRFEILSETNDSYVIGEANSVEYLGTTIDPKAQAPRDHWTRSFQYIPSGDYLLQESSVVLADGTVAEFMESIFPRSTLTPSRSFQKIQMDPSEPAGASDGPAARYRFLPGETIFDGEEKMAFAQHFDIGQDATIDWYATPNISDEHLEVAKDAVEGWNRYFKTFAGINREVVKFKGRLPPGIKIGDPRYNVINWDSKKVAGAAYESQANDPFTGKQSHSLIYMPVAWFQIGMDYWKDGLYSEKQDSLQKIKNKPGLNADCIRDLGGIPAYLNSGRLTEAEAKKFSIQLMKQTLFHEIGHSLGLAHNFKGSLSFDRADPTSLFSDSIMDYNDYELERPVFKDINSSDGPLLEYDRQALSAIYNKMADVKDNDKVLPACNDDEADTQDSGAVDPLCMRYDAERDPTLSVVTAEKRMSEDSLQNDTTLSQALLRVRDQVLSESALDLVNSVEKQVALVKTLEEGLKGVMSFYVNIGKTSLSKTVRNNIKSLYVFEDGILPDGYSEEQMRERAYSGVQNVLGATDLPATVRTTLQKIADEGTQSLSTTPYAQSLNDADATTLTNASQKSLSLVGTDFALSEIYGLVNLRVTVLKSLLRVNTLPLFFGKLGDNPYDFEQNLVSLIDAVLMDQTRDPTERKVAGVVLETYKGRGIADALIQKAHDQAMNELTAASDNEGRELAQYLVNILK